MADAVDLGPASSDDVDDAVANLQSAADWFRTHYITGEDLDRTYRPLRTISGRLYGYLKEVEAERALWWYDIHAMVKAAGESAFLTPAEMWIALLESGAVSIRTKALLETVRRHGLNPDDFRTTPLPPPVEGGDG